MKVCIDPGHGGYDPGAVGPTGLQEKDVALAVSKKLAALLSDAVDVVMTRTTDIALGPDESSDLLTRVVFANSAKVDLYVSIHCNASASKFAQGTETHAFQGSGEGTKLATIIQYALTAACGSNDRGVKYSNLYVLRHTTMPAVLVELAFISNPTEEQLLASARFQNECAQAIAMGIRKYLGLEEVKPVADAPSDWAKRSWEKAVEKKVITDTDPHGTVTREMLAAVLDKAGLV